MVRFLIVFSLVLLSASSVARAQKIEDASICRAALTTIMGQELEDVSISRVSKQVSFLTYRRPDNGVVKFKCHVDGRKIIWATETGRWRDNEFDVDIFFEIKKGVLTIQERHNSGARLDRKFNLKELQDK